MPDLIAFVLLLAITAYSTAGGVDFGAGIWDLLAGNSPRGKEARALIDHAMAPVWEVNNVWLVLAIVICWTGFPKLFQAVFLNLYPVFTVALIGLILRGAFFAFRHVSDTARERRVADVIFGVSSVLTPFFFAACLGAIWLDHPALLAAMFTTVALPFTLAVMVLTPMVALLLWRRVFIAFRLLTVAVAGSLVAVYAVIAFFFVRLLVKLSARWKRDDAAAAPETPEQGVPYGPRPAAPTLEP